MRQCTVCILLVLTLTSWSQNIPLNSWRSHFSYSEARIIEQAESTIFCAVANGLFSVDLSSKSIQKLSKEDGFGDVRITAMHYSGTELIVGYESGVIDLIDSDGSITKITTLRDAQIVAKKTIHSIASSAKGAYLATDFGVVFLDLDASTVKENYRNIGDGGAELEVSEVLVQNDSIYILSESGIQVGSLSNNLLDFNAWTFFPESTTGDFSQLTNGGDNLYVIRDETQLWKLSNTGWIDTGIVFPDSVKALYFQNELLALTSSQIYSALPNPIVLETDDLLVKGNDLIFEGGDYWVADNTNGLLLIGGNSEQILPDGPLSDQPTRMKSINSSTYAFYGPEPAQYDGSSDGLGFSIFNEGQWTQREIPNFFNVNDVAAIGDSHFFTSLGFGLYDEKRDQILDETNSNFTANATFSNVELSAIQSFDNSLWILSFDSDNTLYQLGGDGSISSFSSTKTGTRFPLDLDVSSQGVMWVRRGGSEGGGIATFDPVLDLQRTIRSSDNLPSSSISGIAIDADDDVWISTASGIGNFDAGSFPFGDFNVAIPIFENGLLFEDEKINDVLTDGGGRIWFATQNGVWVLSRNLTSIVHQFTIENSPLPSDNVLQFSYNEESGEVFILTDNGLVSYRSASSGADDIHESEITVFPNPVTPGYAGVVGLSGLARNANIKITNTRGRLVRELQASGGTASWDLRDFNNGKVQAGIYLIFSSSEDGVETLAGKIAVIK